MNLTELLNDLRAKEIELWTEGDRLRYRANATALTPAVLAGLNQHRASLLVLFRDAAAAHRQIQGWSIGPVAPCPPGTVVDWIVAQAARHPTAVAVEDGDTVCRYVEIVDQAQRIASRLTAHGTGPNQMIGLCAERSSRAIAGLLGIQRAGAAYLPLDPAYPAERLGFMMRDARVRLLLADDPSTCSWADPHVTTLALAQAPINSPACLPAIATASDAAYVIYTSGSTGQPKGVVIEHRSLANYTRACIEKFQLSPRDRVLQFASLSFDASVEEIFTTLVAGATLVLRPAELPGSMAEFLDDCRRQALTVLDLPTAFWHQLVIAMTSEQLRLPDTVRLVIIGGEKAWPAQLAQWRTLVGPQVRLLNTYGPTESTIVATWADLTSLPLATEAVPIGRPVQNVEAWILDEQLRPLPVGVRGELYLGGAGLAREYLNRPDLTARAFVPHPFARQPGERLYRTGDLAQWRGDGQIEYCGRADHQVKVRGFRIELDEVAAALREQPHVTEAVVILRDSQLHAYVSLSAPINDLRARLAKQLPAYMVPASITILPALPIGPTGKVDREALPAPVIRQSDAAAPTTELQRQLAAIWAEVLALPVVGIEDDFFALGGHSLLAVQLVERIRTTLDEPITVRALFEHPTVTALAAHLEAIHWARRAQQRSDQALPTGEL